MTLSPAFADVRAIIFDWAGTTIDFGSRAPAAVFVEIFRRRGVEISIAEARAPMGMAKVEHIRAIADMPRVSELWKQTHGRPPTRDDVLGMYEQFLPLQREALAHGSELIPGIAHAVSTCRSLGLRIGSSTGYTKALMEVVRPIAAAQGYTPDVVVCSDEVAAGRPTPWQNFRVAEGLGVYPMRHNLVVDDTPLGIAAGRDAGCRTVAVSMTGNALGLSLDEVQALSPMDLAARLSRIEMQFRDAGADYVLRSAADLPLLLTGEIGGA